MGRLRDLQKQLNTFTTENVEQVILDIAKKDESFIVDLNTQQLFAGKDSAGESLEPYRSVWYADFKLELNSAGVVDLKLTGDFYRGFFIKADSFPIQISSSDIKKDRLVEHYGQNIFGLDEKSQADFNKDILPEVRIGYLNMVQLQ